MIFTKKKKKGWLLHVSCHTSPRVWLREYLYPNWENCHGAKYEDKFISLNQPIRNLILSTYLTLTKANQVATTTIQYTLSIHPPTKRVSFLVYFSQIIEKGKERKKAKLNTMAASLQAAATLMQPTKVGVVSSRSSLQLRSSQTVSKSFGVEPAAARLTCSLQADIKDFAQKCVDASKIAGFALATSALVVSVCISDPQFACERGLKDKQLRNLRLRYDCLRLQIL